jgi:TolB-like protein
MSRRARPAGRAAKATLIVTTMFSTACGYALVGTGAGAGIIPEEVRTVAVTPFENRTTRPEIDQRVTEQVAREFAKRSRRRVVANPANADAVMDGAIVQFQTRPVEFNASGRASRVETVVVLAATLRESATDRVLWSQSSLLFREQYDVADDRDLFAEETLALDDIARGAATTLVTSIVEGF